MRDNKVQFAVVREDPMVEAELVRLTNARNVLLVASGGCTALTLQAMFPDLHITLVDFNPAQLERVREKIIALREVDRAARHRKFNIGTSDPKGLNQSGNFESLFRGLREFIFDLVADEVEIRGLFEENGRLAEVSEVLFSNKYWPVAFDLYFSDSLLNAMFGLNATQHAETGSYPRYFQRLFEEGLTSAAAFNNYFLHHVFLGYYLERSDSLPYYLLVPSTAYRFQMVEGTLDQVPELQRFDLISLSNIMDWMPLPEIAALIGHLQNEMASGASVLYRQLNNYTDLSAYFGDSFEFNVALGVRFQEIERSPILRGHFGGVSYLSLEGKKDIILQSTGSRMPLLHVQFGPCAEQGHPKPLDDYVHMFCVSVDHPLLDVLKHQSIYPSATATVIHHRMEKWDWRFILTSDI